MFDWNTLLKYPLLLISSIGKRNFSELARTAKESVYLTRKSLSPSAVSLKLARRIAQFIFGNPKEIVLAIDDSLFHKTHSRFMVGAARFFDTKLYRRVMAYRAIVGVVTNGKITIPIGFGFMFAKELLPDSAQVKSKLDFIKDFLGIAQNLFSSATITIVADGLFASKEIIQWALHHKIRLTVRMHSNRKVMYKGKSYSIRDIKSLIPKGRQMARTIAAGWHDMNLLITAERRIDKKGDESIVYLASTYDAKPAQHVNYYKKRWPIEKLFRTTKQYLGITHCASTCLETQSNHVAASLLAYSLAQLEQHKQKFDTPEQAVRYIKLQNIHLYSNRIIRIYQIFDDSFL